MIFKDLRKSNGKMWMRDAKNLTKKRTIKSLSIAMDCDRLTMMKYEKVAE